MEIKPIKTEAEYNGAIKVIDKLIDCKENSKESLQDQ